MKTKAEKWRDLFSTIATLNQTLRDLELRFLHGIIYGLDYPYHKDLAISSDFDQTTYHALVLDDRKYDPASHLKDILTGKNLSSLVERFQTTDPDEAIEFFKKYHVI